MQIEMGVTFIVTPASETVPEAGGDVTCKVEIGADRDTRSQTLAKHIVLCVDSSSSMSGNKIDNVKQGARATIDELDSEDRVSVVEFDTTATTILEPCSISGNRSRAKSRIGELEAGGGTDIIAGLQIAAATLDEDTSDKSGNLAESTSSDPNHGLTKWLILLSDGKPSSVRSLLGMEPNDESIQEHIDLAEKLGANGITIQSLGVGTDYSEPIMRGVAEATQGRFKHISNPTDVKSLFSETVNEAARIIEANPTLKLYPEGSVPIKSVYQREPSLIEFSPEHRGDHLEVDLTDIGSDSTQEILIEANVPRGEVGDSKTILEFELELSGAILKDTVSVTYEGGSKGRLTTTDKERIDTRARRLAIEETPETAASYLERQDSRAVQEETRKYIQELKEAEASGDDEKRLKTKNRLTRPVKVEDPDEPKPSSGESESGPEKAHPRDPTENVETHEGTGAEKTGETGAAESSYVILPSEEVLKQGESLEVEVRNEDGSRVADAVVEYDGGSAMTDGQGVATFEFATPGTKELSLKSESSVRGNRTSVKVESVDETPEDDTELESEESTEAQTRVALIPDRKSVSAGQELEITVRDNGGERVKGVSLSIGDKITETDQQGGRLSR
jgi:Ca-activated chloride channel family protein